MNKRAAEISYDDISLGDKASFKVVITESLVNDFGKVSGDENPLHLDEEYASGTAFGRRIAHGMIVGALFSRLIGMYLPGKHSLYVSQTLNFRNPIGIGSELDISGEVVHKSDAVRIVTVRTTAEDAQSKKIAVNGEAIVKLLK